MKSENQQAFGSYKIRGVLEAIRRADPRVVCKGLAAASAGNMAQAVAYAAKKAGVPCRIYLPNTAPEVKRKVIREWGAELVEMPFEEVWALVKNPSKVVDERLFIHPVHTPGLLEGYGSIADEILSAQPDFDAIVIPFGVGGLTLGVASRMKELKPEVAVYTCEPETAAPLYQSLQAGKLTGVIRTPSFVDAIGTPEVLPEVFSLARKAVQGALVVTLQETRSALKTLCHQYGLRCEGAGAAALAGAIQLQEQSDYKQIACILSGGNIDSNVFDRLVQ